MQKGIVLFDDVCNLCNGWVDFLLKQDKKERLIFGSLQSLSAKSILHSHSINPEALNSIIFIANGKAYRESSAVLEICKALGGFWKIFYVFKIIPPILRNGIYRLVARYRYQWFGKTNTCRLPKASEIKRFIDN